MAPDFVINEAGGKLTVVRSERKKSVMLQLTASGGVCALKCLSSRGNWIPGKRLTWRDRN
jgi:hypothetical protein